eukprot:COSAG01_NODE_4625_length_4865_cov_7.434326_2_plen_587_part_00
MLVGPVLLCLRTNIATQTPSRGVCPWAPWSFTVAHMQSCQNWTNGARRYDLCNASFDPGRCASLSENQCQCCSVPCHTYKGYDALASGAQFGTLRESGQVYWDDGAAGPTKVPEVCDSCGGNPGSDIGCVYPGTYGDPNHGVKCRACPAGRYAEGTVVALACAPCASGLMSPPGSAFCSAACPPGYFQSGPSTCAACPGANVTTSPAGSTSYRNCTCMAGTFGQVHASSADCVACPDGYSSPAGAALATDCSMCGAGTFAPRLSDAPPWYARGKGCLLCRGNTTSRAGAWAVGMCMCPVGMYGYGFMGGSWRMCTACPAGKTSRFGARYASQCVYPRNCTTENAAQYPLEDDQLVCGVCGAGAKGTANKRGERACRCSNDGEQYTSDGCIVCPHAHHCAGAQQCSEIKLHNESGPNGAYIQYTSCVGTCATGYAGFACAECATGFFQIGTRCLECPEDTSKIILQVVTAVIILTICAMIWQMSAMHNDEHDTAQEDNTKTEAETTAEVVTTTREAAHTLGKISDAAIVSSIVLPNLFQISITLTLPFGFPCVFTNRAGTHSVHTQSFGCILSICASCAEYSGSWCC